jgi:hypothetical protein
VALDAVNVSDRVLSCQQNSHLLRARLDVDPWNAKTQRGGRVMPASEHMMSQTVFLSSGERTRRDDAVTYT